MSSSVNSYLRQSDYTYLEELLYIHYLYLFYLNSSPEITLRDTELLLMSVICDYVCNDNAWGCNFIHFIYCNKLYIKIHKIYSCTCT